MGNIPFGRCCQIFPPNATVADSSSWGRRIFYTLNNPDFTSHLNSISWMAVIHRRGAASEPVSVCEGVYMYTGASSWQHCKRVHEWICDECVFIFRDLWIGISHLICVSTCSIKTHPEMLGWDWVQPVCVCVCVLPAVALELAAAVAGPGVEGETEFVASAEEWSSVDSSSPWTQEPGGITGHFHMIYFDRRATINAVPRLLVQAGKANVSYARFMT